MKVIIIPILNIFTIMLLFIACVIGSIVLLIWSGSISKDSIFNIPTNHKDIRKCMTGSFFTTYILDRI